MKIDYWEMHLKTCVYYLHMKLRINWDFFFFCIVPQEIIKIIDEMWRKWCKIKVFRTWKIKILHVLFQDLKVFKQMYDFVSKNRNQVEKEKIVDYTGHWRYDLRLQIISRYKILKVVFRNYRVSNFSGKQTYF